MLRLIMPGFVLFAGLCVLGGCASTGDTDGGDGEGGVILADSCPEFLQFEPTAAPPPDSVNLVAGRSSGPLGDGTYTISYVVLNDESLPVARETIFSVAPGDYTTPSSVAPTTSVTIELKLLSLSFGKYTVTATIEHADCPSITTTDALVVKFGG